MTAKLRVLTVCHGHPDLVSGGTEVFSHGLCRALGVDGRTRPLFVGAVTALHRPEPPGNHLQVLGGLVDDDCLLWVGGFDRLMLAQTDPGPCIDAFSRLLSTFRPNIVHLHHFSLVGLEVLTAIRRVRPDARIVVTLHDYHPICVNDGLMLTIGDELCRRASGDACHACFPEIAAERFAARALHVRSMLELVDRFIAPSRTLRDRFVAWGLPAERIEVIANAVVDTPGRSCLSDDDRPRTTFGYFGNISRHKGVLLALDAVGALAREGEVATLRLHGRLQFPAPSFHRAFNEAVARTPAASWSGAYDQAELPDLMRRVDWVVVPSTWWENAPLVILEAFRNGRPVVCADVGGMAELVQHEINGLHFRCGDAADLARTMRRAVREPGLWQRLAAGVPTVRTMEEAAADHVALYRRLSRTRSVRCAS